MEKLFEAVAGIDAGSEVVELTTFVAENTKIKKTISYDQFCEALLSGRGPAQSIKIGLFPREVLSVVWGEHDRKIYLFIPTAVRFLGYQKQISTRGNPGIHGPIPEYDFGNYLERIGLSRMPNFCMVHKQHRAVADSRYIVISVSFWKCF